MHTQIFWRLMWKEYRSQRGLWIGVAVLAVFVQIVILAVSRDAHNAAKDAYYIALILPMLYALASTAVLFAAEKEEGTFDLLRSLPVSPERLFAAKLCYCLCTSLAMLFALHAATWAMSLGKVPEVGAVQGRHFELIPMILVTGVFFSLMMNRVLNVLVATAFVVLALDLNNMPIVKWGSMLAFFVADVWLVRRWFLDGSLVRERIGHLFEHVPLRVRFRTRTADRAIAKAETSSPAWRAWKRMLWMEYRHARMTLFVWFPLALVLVAISRWSYLFIGVDFTYVVLPIAPLLLGLAVFRGHQREERVRYLAQQGISPKLVWAGTQMVWVTSAVVIVWCLLLTAQYFVIDGPRDQYYSNFFGDFATEMDSHPFVFFGNSYADHLSEWHAFYYWIAALSFAAGQMCSFLFRRTVTAAMAGIILAVGGYVWVSVLVRLMLPYVVVAAPLVMMWWLIPRFGLNRWALGTHTWKTRLKGAAGIVSVHGLYVWALVGLRTYGIPDSELVHAWVTKNSAIYPRTALLATQGGNDHSVYVEAAALVTNDRPSYSSDTQNEHDNDRDALLQLDLAWLSENDAALTLVSSGVEANASLNSSRLTPQDLSRCLNLLLVSAQKLTLDGDLEGALARYDSALRFSRLWAARDTVPPSSRHFVLYNYYVGLNVSQRIYLELVEWAGHERQTPEVLRLAPPLLEKHRREFPWFAERWAEYYAFYRRQLLQEENGVNRLDTFYIGGFGYLLKFPWEKDRLMRILDTDAFFTYYRLYRVENALLPQNEDQLDLQQNFRDVFDNSEQNRIVHADRFRQVFAHDTTPDLASRIDHEAIYRVCRLIFELSAQRLEQGELPHRLIEAIPNLTLTDLFDPWSGRPFDYYPEGVPAELRVRKKVAPHQPFIWCVGRQNSKLLKVKVPDDERTFYVVGPHYMTPENAYHQYWLFRPDGGDADRHDFHEFIFPIPLK